MMLTFLLGLGAFVLGLFMALAGRKLWRPLFWPGVALMSLVGAWVIAGIYQDAMLEWNPMIREDAQIIGTWTDGRETITLHADHRFDYHTPEQRFSGIWSRNDWTLLVQARGIAPEMRFVMYGSKTYLMPHVPMDPDHWNGDLGLERAP